MKKLKFLLFLFAVAATGCSSDDDKSNGHDPIGLEGKWHLTEVHHGFMGGTSEFDEGMVSWDFDESERKVKIINNSADPMSGHATGNYEYDFEVIEQVCDNGFIIGNTEYGCVYIDGNTLRLSDSHLDGPVYIFTK